MISRTDIKYMKCNHCGHYFVTYLFFPKCKECGLKVSMSMRDQIEANMRKEMYDNHKIALYAGFDGKSVFKNTCKNCETKFFTENKWLKECIPCRRNANPRGLKKL